MSGSMTTTAPAVDLFALPPLPAGAAAAAVIAVGVPGASGAPGTAYQAPLAANPLGFQTLTQVSAAIATAISGVSAPVVSFNGRTGAILLSNADVLQALQLTPYSAANPSNYQTATQVAAAIQGVVGAAPAALSTLQQIAAELLNDENAVGALTATVATKLSRTSNLSDLSSPAAARSNLGLAAVASSGSYNDLVNTPAPFTLPQASMSVAGGVKVDGTSIVISSAGVISAPGAGGGGGVPVTPIAASGAAQTIAFPAVGLAVVDITLSANCTLSLSGGTAGQRVAVEVWLRQPSTGGIVVTLPAGVRWPGNVTPTPGTGANGIDIYTFYTPDGGATVAGSY